VFQILRLGLLKSSAMPNFLPVSQTIAEMQHFNGFNDGGRLPYFCENFQFLTGRFSVLWV